VCPHRAGAPFVPLQAASKRRYSPSSASASSTRGFSTCSPVEALSRGAAHVTFVESDRRTAAALRSTAESLALGDRCIVMAVPAERVAARLRERYDVVFADPPYARPYPAALFAQLRGGGAIDADTLVVYEHSATQAVAVDVRFEVVRTARYGAVALAFLKAVA